MIYSVNQGKAYPLTRGSIMILRQQFFTHICLLFSVVTLGGCAFRKNYMPHFATWQSQPIVEQKPTKELQNTLNTAATWQEYTSLKSTQRSPYTALIFSPDNEYLVTCNHKGTIESWDLKNSKIERTWTVPAPITLFAFAPNGTQLAATTQGDEDSVTYIWQWPSGKNLHTLHDPSGIEFLSYSNDSKELITASCTSGLINYWDASNGSLQRSLRIDLHTEEDYIAQSITIAPNGNYIATTHNHWYYPEGLLVDPEISYDYLNEVCVKIWDGADGTLLKKINTGMIDYARCASNNEIIFSPDSKTIATGHLHSQLCLITAPQWSVKKLDGYYTEVPFYSLKEQQILAFSPDSTYLAATTLGEVDHEVHETIVWNIKTGEIEKQYPSSNLIAFSPNGKLCALSKQSYEPITSSLELSMLS